MAKEIRYTHHTKTLKRATTRLQGYDYGERGAYFVTICTHDRVCHFGDIVGEEMHLNALGQLAEKHWQEIPEHFPFIALGEFVVMPNHIHGILMITTSDNKARHLVGARFIAPSSPEMERSKTDPDPGPGGFAGNKNPMLQDNISRVLRWYKGRCSFEMRKIHTGFGWQRLFHDHIIRNDVEYQRIADYIIHNPANWSKDKFRGRPRCPG